VSYTLAIGPHAPLWNTAQRLVLKVDGEVVTDVTYRDNDDAFAFLARLPRMEPEHVLEKIVQSRRDSAHAHALAFCQAIEALMNMSVPERAAYLRCAIAETERVVSHLHIMDTLFTALGQQQQAANVHRLEGQAREALLLLSGTTDMPNVCVPGGVQRDIQHEEHTWLLKLLATIKQRLFVLIDQVIDEPRLLARTVDVGTLSRAVVSQFELRGPLARAAGLEVDGRLELPYASYPRLIVRRVLQEGGDVHARLVVLLLESFESIKLVEQILHELPAGPWEGAFPQDLASGQASGHVESPRGLLRYTIQSDGFRLTDVIIDEPRQLDRLLARTLFVGALLDNVVLIALSTLPLLDTAESESTL
jgi:Ni,Fe-hydrogenase III large subunit